MFKIRDTVWAMHDNRPTEMIVAAKIEASNINESDSLWYYQLVRKGATLTTVKGAYARLPGMRYPAREVFPTKEKLLDSFL